MIKDKNMFEQALSEIRNGYVIAQCTDKLLIEKYDEQYVWDVDYLYNRAIDIRLFNKNSEMHLFRNSMNEEFRQRLILSDEKAVEFSPESYKQIIKEDTVSVYYDENQFLDIDTKKGNHQKYEAYATGGGKYKLPIEHYNGAKIIIRNYIGFEKNTGRAYVKDWRIVDFKEGK